jgi:hypothetical protein
MGSSFRKYSGDENKVKCHHNVQQSLCFASLTMFSEVARDVSVAQEASGNLKDVRAASCFPVFFVC